MLKLQSAITLFNKWKEKVDWRLLIFLILFMDVKLIVKVVAIIMVFALNRNFDFGFRLKNSRLPLFYPAVIAIALLNWVFMKGYSSVDYSLLILTGLAFWLLCMLASHQIKLFVELTNTEIIHRTIVIFFLLNALVSFWNIASIIAEIQVLNPYKYQGDYQKYFISTGDYIRGITFDVSTTNAVLNAFGLVYFLARTQVALALLCMITLLLTGSNFMNLILVLIFGFLFFFKSTRDQKSIMVICTMLLIVFMVKVSPQNNQYSMAVIRNLFDKNVNATHTTPVKPGDIMKEALPGSEVFMQAKAKAVLDQIKAREAKKEMLLQAKSVINDPKVPKSDNGRISLPKADIHSASYQSRNETPSEQQSLLKFIQGYSHNLPVSGSRSNTSELPGKIIAMYQTFNYLGEHPGNILTGFGMGNFSSKLAFRATRLGFSGGYPEKYQYIHSAFMQNHLDLYLNYFSKSAGFHSLIHSPFSVYDQLLSEYGLLGLFALMVCYFWFFLKHYRKLTYGIPLLMMLAGIFFIEYWFEQLSIILFFELLLFLDLKENGTKPVFHGK